MKLSVFLSLDFNNCFGCQAETVWYSKMNEKRVLSVPLMSGQFPVFLVSCSMTQNMLPERLKPVTHQSQVEHFTTV